jgi:hypothetical protein
MQYTGSPTTKTIVMPRWSVSLLIFKRDATVIGSKRTNSFHNNELYQLNGTTLVSSMPRGNPMSISIFSASGELVRSFTQKEQTVNIGTGLSKGIYLILIKSPGILVSKKMIVNR